MNENGDVMRTLRLFGVLLLVVAFAFVVMLVLGGRQPRAHIVSASTVINAPQQRVWHLIEDVQDQPSWRPGLKAVKALPAEAGHSCWMEIQKLGQMPLCEVLAAAPSTRIVRIVDTNLPYGGTWTYELSPAGPTATVVTITENSTTGPLIWRFVGHYILHEDTLIKQYETALQAEAVRPS